MSTPQAERTTEETAQHRTVLIGAIIIMVAVIGVGLVSFFFGKEQAQKHQPPIPVMDASSGRVSGAQVYSWDGVVTSIKGTDITFSTPVKSDDGDISQRVYTAVLDAGTSLMRWDITQPSGGIDQGNQRSSATVNDIQPGQRVVIQSSANVDNNDTIVAESVTVLVTPQTE